MVRLSVGKSTLTDSLVAAAGIIAMENVSCNLHVKNSDFCRMTCMSSLVVDFQDALFSLV